MTNVRVVTFFIPCLLLTSGFGGTRTEFVSAEKHLLLNTNYDRITYFFPVRPTAIHEIARGIVLGGGTGCEPQGYDEIKRTRYHVYFLTNIIPSVYRDSDQDY